MAAIVEAIDLAKERQGWTYKTLAQRLGKAENTLTSWRKGEVDAISLPSLVQLFRWAQLSMDTAFDLQGRGTPIEAAGEAAWRERAERAEAVVDKLLADAGHHPPGEGQSQIEEAARIADEIIRRATDQAPPATTQPLRAMKNARELLSGADSKGQLELDREGT